MGPAETPGWQLHVPRRANSTRRTLGVGAVAADGVGSHLLRHLHQPSPMGSQPAACRATALEKSQRQKPTPQGPPAPAGQGPNPQTPATTAGPTWRYRSLSCWGALKNATEP